MNRRTRKIPTEVRRGQIARAGLALIEQRGLSHLSIGALARQVGVVPSAIYRHYPGKDEVLAAVLDLISRRLRANVDAVCEETADPLEGLHQLLRRHVQLIRHHAGIPRVMFSEQIFAGHPRRRRQLDRTLRGYLQKIAGIVRDGQRQGQLRADARPGVVSLMFLGLVQPAVILWVASRGTFDVARQTEHAWELFRGMLATGARAARAGTGSRRRNERAKLIKST